MNSAMVKINSASANTGDLHRAISLSKKLMEAGKWDGQSLIIWDSAETVRKAIAWQQLSGELPETGWSVKGEELRVDGLEILEGKYEVGDRPHVAVKYEDILYIIHPDDHIIVSKKDKHGITYRVLEIAGVAYYMHQLRYEAGRPNLLARVEELAEGLRKIRDGVGRRKAKSIRYHPGAVPSRIQPLINCPGLHYRKLLRFCGVQIRLRETLEQVTQRSILPERN